MTKKWTLDEWLFAIGVYPSLQAQDRFTLCLEISYDFYVGGSEDKLRIYNMLNDRKRLSDRKKASFLTFVNQLDIHTEMSRYHHYNIQWVNIIDEKYPKQLLSIYNPPVVLFYRGAFEMIHDYEWLGVVGARACTDYGLKAVDYIVGDLLKRYRHSVGIVSGLARGIDTRSHIITLQNQGQTIGVIGSGLDRYYPYENRGLQNKMMQDHLVITEYPLGAKPLKHRFPERNRIISGLSRGILVIEAKKRSGSLITAYNGIDEGRDIFAVPGSIFELNREGTNRLIQLGAILTKSADDIAKEWHLNSIVETQNNF